MTRASGARPENRTDSLARHAGVDAAACLLTGMGGADGPLRMREAGALTLAQDRETSAVWGMPAAAAPAP